MADTSSFLISLRSNITLPIPWKDDAWFWKEYGTAILNYTSALICHLKKLINLSQIVVLCKTLFLSAVVFGWVIILVWKPRYVQCVLQYKNNVSKLQVIIIWTYKDNSNYPALKQSSERHLKILEKFNGDPWRPW